MRSKLAVYFCLLALGGSQPSVTQAYWISGNKLHDKCSTDKFYVYGYVLGLSDGTLLGHEREPDLYYCLPNEIQAGQMLDVVCQYLVANPEERHHPAAFLATQALIEAFPCP